MLKGECGKKQATEDGVGVNVGVFDVEEAGVVPGGHWHGVGGNGVDDDGGGGDGGGGGGDGDGDGDGAAWEETRKSTKSTASVATIVAVFGGGVSGVSGGRMDQSFALGCCFFHRRRRFISMSCAVQEAYSLPVSPLTNSASTTPVPVS